MATGANTPEANNQQMSAATGRHFTICSFPKLSIS
jgi:hypothetical protein